MNEWVNIYTWSVSTSTQQLACSQLHTHTCIQCVRHSVIHVYSAYVTQSYIHVYSAYVTQSYMYKQKLADMAVECDCHQHYTPSRTLRSASDTLSLQIPRIRLSTVGSRAFSVFGPSTWNDLPLPLRQKLSLDSFKWNLKPFLYPKRQRPAIFSVPCCCLHPSQVSVCCPF